MKDRNEFTPSEVRCNKRKKFEDEKKFARNHANDYAIVLSFKNNHAIDQEKSLGSYFISYFFLLEITTSVLSTVPIVCCTTQALRQYSFN